MKLLTLPERHPIVVICWLSPHSALTGDTNPKSLNLHGEINEIGKLVDPRCNNWDLYCKCVVAQLAPPINPPCTITHTVTAPHSSTFCISTEANCNGRGQKGILTCHTESSRQWRKYFENWTFPFSTRQGEGSSKDTSYHLVCLSYTYIAIVLAINISYSPFFVSYFLKLQKIFASLIQNTFF